MPKPHRTYGPGPTSPARVLRRDRMTKAWELRKAGKQYAEIATALGISRDTVSRLVREMVVEMRDKGYAVAEQQLALESSRLDEMLANVWIKARAGDPDSVQAVLRIMERRSKLLGLDAPPKVQQTQESTPTDAELLDLAERYGVELDPKLKQSLQAKRGDSHGTSIGTPGTSIASANENGNAANAGGPGATRAVRPADAETRALLSHTNFLDGDIDAF